MMRNATRKKAALLKMAQDLGRLRALDEQGLLKNANVLGAMLDRSAPIWAPAALGYVLGGPEHRLEGAAAGALGGHLGRGFLRNLSVRGLRETLPKHPELSGLATLSDRQLLSALKASPAVQSGPQMQHIRDFLGNLGKYEGFGSLAGGGLAGYGVGKILGSQDKPVQPVRFAV